MHPKKAIVLLSGGLDSTTTLAIAKSQGYQCYCLSFDYGQKHRSELTAAARIAACFQSEHKVISLGLGDFGGSALTDSEIQIPNHRTQGIPTTYVPARNTVFLALALSWAEVLRAMQIFIGVNAVDYSGYPDCRPKFIQAFTDVANLATKLGAEGQLFSIQTPLISLSKAQIIKMGLALDIDYSLTISCYSADEQGLACGQCDSCHFRRQGFLDLGVADPTRYQTKA